MKKGAEKKSDRKVALVTGGSTGIGREICLGLAKKGIDVAFNYSADDKLAAQTKKEIEKNPVNVMTFKASVVDSVAVQAMVDEVCKKFGRIDILVNNAGKTDVQPIVVMGEQDWDEIININLKGVFVCSRAVVPTMISQSGGKIINISSVVALRGFSGQAHYSASKGGVISFTKSLAKELAPFDICVNAVTPGLMETRMAKRLPEKQLEEYISLVPMGRLGRPQEVAGVVLFLASEYADYITGEVISVDGGLN